MIFVTVGSQQYQFNRLLIALDELKGNGEITDIIFAQTGTSTYKPQNFGYKDFISQKEYADYIKKAELVITHGGTGAIIKALKEGKQVIAVPRQLKYQEHADDHQFQIVDFLEKEGFIRSVRNMSDMLSVIKETKENPIQKRFIGKGRIIEIIDKQLQSYIGDSR